MNTRYIGKKVLYVIAVLLAACTLVSCKGYKQIPEDTLASIFKDMYLLNAYIDRHSLGQQLDSIDVYEPILQSYGFTTKDFKNTIVDESKRKSFRLTDIVDRAIAMLEREQVSVEERVRVADYIDSLALAVSTREIYRLDSAIVIHSKADLVNHRIAIPLDYDDYTGRFEISYYYTLDSIDDNKNLMNKHFLVNSAGVPGSATTLRLQKRKNSKHTTGLSVMNDADTLVMTFGNYPEDAKRMGLTIDSLTVKFLPVLVNAYVILSEEYSYRLLIDEKEVNEYYYTPKENRRSLYLLSPIVAEERDSDVVE